MAADVYAIVADLCGRLDDEGREEDADAIREAVATGATGTEVFMALRQTLRRIREDGRPASPGSRGRIAELLDVLDRALG